MKTKRRHLLVIAAAAASTGALAACGGEPGDDDGSGAGASGSGASGAGGGDPGTFPMGYIDLGPVEALPIGSLVTVAFVELLVGRDDDGVYAMTSRCTHQGCNMIGNEGITPGNITECGCHGSRFDPNGVPLNGPAAQPLAHYSVIINEMQRIGVNTSIEVGLDERAPV